MRSRISSSSRCRRCFRCCGSSSMSRGRCSGCWSACSTPRAASRSSSAGFAVDRVGARPVLLGGLGLARRRHHRRSTRSRRVLAVSDRRADGRRQWRLPSRRFRDPQRQRRAAPPGLRLFDARRGRQHRLRDGAHRGLCAGGGVQLADRAGLHGDCRHDRAGRPRVATNLPHVASRARRAHAHAGRQHVAVPAAGHRAVLLFLPDPDHGVRGPAGVPAFRAEQRARGAAAARGVRRHRLLAGRHRRHRGRRLPGGENGSARPRRRDRIARRRRAAGRRGDRRRTGATDRAHVSR